MLAAILATLPVGPSPTTDVGEGVGLFWYPDRARRRKLLQDREDDELVVLLAGAAQPWRK